MLSPPITEMICDHRLRFTTFRVGALDIVRFARAPSPELLKCAIVRAEPASRKRYFTSSLSFLASKPEVSRLLLWNHLSWPKRSAFLQKMPWRLCSPEARELCSSSPRLRVPGCGSETRNRQYHSLGRRCGA